MQGVAYLSRTLEPNALTWLAGELVVVSGLALLAGFLTPASGAIAGLTAVLIVAAWTPPGTSVLIERFVALILIVADALVLLDPIVRLPCARDHSVSNDSSRRCWWSSSD